MGDELFRMATATVVAVGYLAGATAFRVRLYRGEPNPLEALRKYGEALHEANPVIYFFTWPQQKLAEAFLDKRAKSSKST